MNDGDKKRFAVAMNWLAEKVARDGEPTELTKQQLADYFKALKNLSIGAVETAVKNYFAGSRYRIFPLPGEIRAFVTADRQGDEPRQIPETTSPVLPPNLLEEYQKDAQRVFNMAQSDMPLEEQIGFMQNMDLAYPGFGWGDGLDKYQAHRQKMQADNDARYARIAERRRNSLSDSV